VSSSLTHRYLSVHSVAFMTPTPWLSSIGLKDGSSMPYPIYGTGTSLRGKEVHQLVANAIKAGYRHLDCAQMYANEVSVGRGIAESGVSRDELYITTKVVSVPEGLTVSDSLRDSLQKMKLDYVDLCLIHEPVGHRDLRDTWSEMERCKEEGLARSIGVSNFRVQDFEEISAGSTSLPVVNQVKQYLSLFL
jgi:diketogulonate reductase-like aldo/keto reductase